MGHWLNLKSAHSLLNLRILSSTSVPFTVYTHDDGEVPNLALYQTKRITVPISIKDNFFTFMTQLFIVFFCYAEGHVNCLVRPWVTGFVLQAGKRVGSY